MNNKLSVASRILVAFASGALIAVFFLPVWRIDLFAPQYPEGLTMYIWINNITGDVDVINGLNHYIGMKHITVAMFPELKFLSAVVGFFMLLGMIVAITGKRKFLFYYLALTVIGGALAMYDFYSWGYKYGHDLDPKAPIRVPGLSYQPPLFGHKRLLNFDAYSFPDVAGWIVIGAATLAFVVWFVEWYRHGKGFFKRKPAALMIGTLSILSLASCHTKPQPFETGKDACYFCKMGITDTRFGGEVLTKKGKVYKFDDLHCMISFLKEDAEEEKNISGKVVIDFEKPNQFVGAATTSFVVSPELKSPMGSNAAGFVSKKKAEDYVKNNQGEILSWEQLNSKVQ